MFISDLISTRRARENKWFAKYLTNIGISWECLGRCTLDSSRVNIPLRKKSCKFIHPGSYESIDFGLPPDELYDEPTDLLIDNDECLDLCL